MIKRSFKLVAVVLSFVLAISICGVFATWTFADKSPDEAVSDNITLDYADYVWEKSALLEALLEELNKENSVLNNYIQERFEGQRGLLTTYGQHSFYGSNDPNYKVSNTSSYSELGDCTYLIRAMVDSSYSNADTYTTMYIYYTYVVLVNDSGDPTIPLGGIIYRVYRTELSRYKTDNGDMSDWEIVETLLGYAPLCWYLDQSNGVNNQYDDEIPSIDMVAWNQGIYGYNHDTAVPTFDGDKPSAYNDLYDDNFDLEKTNYTSGDCFYYVLETSGNTYYCYYNDGFVYASRFGSYSTSTYSQNATGTYTITCDLETASIRVYTVSGSTQTDLPLTQNTVSEGISYSFSASSTKTKYYIEVDSGGQTANLSIAKA